MIHADHCTTWTSANGHSRFLGKQASPPCRFSRSTGSTFNGLLILVSSTRGFAYYRTPHAHWGVPSRSSRRCGTTKTDQIGRKLVYLAHCTVGEVNSFLPPHPIFCGLFRRRMESRPMRCCRCLGAPMPTDWLLHSSSGRALSPDDPAPVLLGSRVELETVRRRYMGRPWVIV